MKMKAIKINVYRSADGRDCTNGGISSRFRELLIEHPEGWVSVDENDPPENLCRVVCRHLFGADYYHIEPVKAPEHLGWMMGGNYAATSDSRFREMVGGLSAAIAIHDRQETQREYDLYSR